MWLSYTWGPPTLGEYTFPSSNCMEVKSMVKWGTHDGGKIAPQNLYKEGNSPHFIIFWHIEILFGCSSCLAKSLVVYQESSSEELTLSSRDFKCHPRGSYSFFRRRISLWFPTVAFIISRWYVFLEDVVKGGRVWLWHLSEEFWAGEITERRHRCLAAILVSFGVGGECSYSVWLSHFLGQRRGSVLCTRGRWSIIYWGWSLSGELREALVEEIATFPEPWRENSLVSLQAVFLSSLGGHRASCRPILGGWI